MTTTNELVLLLRDGFSDDKSLIKQSDIKILENAFKDLEESEAKKGYTIPPLDTIGMNLYGKFSSQIINA